MSEIPPASSPKKEIIAPRHESIAEEFADDPPESEHNYGAARLWLVARDPRCLFSYWEFRPEEHPDAVGADGRAQFFLRICREDGAIASIIKIQPGSGNVFMPSQSPDSGYFAELGFYSGEIWCFLARSGNTRTPPELHVPTVPVVFATIPAHISLGKFRAALANSALPGESLAATVARIQADSRQHGEWTPEQERLLAEILGEDMAGAAPFPSPFTLAERIHHKLAAAGRAAAPMSPIPAPQPENAPSSAGASWPSSSDAMRRP